MKNYTTEAAEVRKKIAQTIEHEYRKRHAIIKHKSHIFAASTIIATIYIAVNMKLTIGEIIAFSACILLNILFLYTIWKNKRYAKTIKKDIKEILILISDKFKN